ncbi:MAG: hypothetical protein KGD67_02635 [Candidatus Lokiarchaeota archaeon]|nr:hypothetical protein [Candidatus Lokiarchaeota archaeon]
MIVNTERYILCKLGGFDLSSPEIVISYPTLDPALSESEDLLSKCLPTGIKSGDFAVNKYSKCNLLSYAFKIEHQEERNDLLTISILIKKKLNVEIYKPVLENIVSTLNYCGLLTEQILVDYIQTIYEGINQEKLVLVDDVPIDLSIIFKDIKSKLYKPRPEVKGSFF